MFLNPLPGMRGVANRKLAYPTMKACISYFFESVRTMREEWNLTFHGDVTAS